MTKKLKDNILGAILITVSIVGMVIICFTINSGDIWYDEVFSMEFASRSFGEIVALTGADVHPPLYYFYLKIFILIGTRIFPGINSVILAKAASILPLIVILIISVTVIRKDFGWVCASFFAMLVTLMPNLASYFVEIRMYSFALMIVTIAFIGAYRLILDENGKHTSCWVIFAIFGLMGAYTQYYVCIAIIGLYISLALFFIITKRYRQFIPWGICAALSAVCYIPWLPYLGRQVSAVSTNYWIEPLTVKSIFGCIKYMYLPSVGLGVKGYVIAAIMIAATLMIMVFFVKNHPNVNALFIGFTGLITLVITVLSGFAFSILGRPIFVYRYMVPVFGVFYLGIAYMASEAFDRKRIALWIVAAVFIIGGHYSLSTFEYGEKDKPIKMKEAYEVLDSIPDDAVVVTNFDQICTLMDYYLTGHRIYLYEDETDPIVALMYNNDGQRISEDELVELSEKEQNLLFFGSFNSREELLKDWESLGIENEVYADSVMIERYYFNIYKLY